METGHGWILTHRPIWGLDPKVISRNKKSGDPADPLPANLPEPLPGFAAVDFPSNRTEQVASDNHNLAGTDMVLRPRAYPRRAQQPAVGDCDTMGEGAEITQHMSRSAEEPLGVDDPIVGEQHPPQRRCAADPGLVKAQHLRPL